MMFYIRQATFLDIPQLIEIEKSANQAFAQIPALAWLVESSVMSGDEHLDLIKNNYSFVAVNEHDQIAGFLYAEKQDNDLYIIEVDVSSEHQKQGIGQQLMFHVIDFAKQHAFQAVTLTTFIDVAWNKDFYEKLGFKLLDQQDLKPYLKQKIDNEVEHGFVRDSRCAMQFML